ncbi:SDR family NAD(P)-dependent oxidoreductase [Subtercola sp. PAMC28395]|uniref:SDR family NAD(P)-dependent oxidoreductase n=1 Tax=Subtercola sp. PAMC28395 TaxID=2846775 RepID=UPI001C0CEA6E|nr:SDR family NAD(P)-dependent oxidoreductase [Subtercola sp. PAMC28395]QWT25255.1 SDR family NAD(P)-dependent oxidoreductase [Subtercola sp. PAMC28395]
MDIRGASAIITGGASGLGLATARRLIAGGARVTLVDLPSSAGTDVASDLGTSAQFVAADVTNGPEVEAAVAAAARTGPLRVVVNCAGIGTPALTIRGSVPLELDAFERVIRVNLIGTFNVIRLSAVELLRSEQQGEERGVIINTASVAAYDGQIGQAAYAASKGGIVSMTLPLAREFARSLVRVVTIAPGLFETPLLATLPKDARDSLGQQVPHPARLGRADEYAALVEHIVSNAMLNGEVIRLDGAIRMAPK